MKKSKDQDESHETSVDKKDGKNKKKTKNKKEVALDADKERDTAYARMKRRLQSARRHRYRAQFAVEKESDESVDEQSQNEETIIHELAQINEENSDDEDDFENESPHPQVHVRRYDTPTMTYEEESTSDVDDNTHRVLDIDDPLQAKVKPGLPPEASRIPPFFHDMMLYSRACIFLVFIMTLIVGLYGFGALLGVITVKPDKLSLYRGGEYSSGLGGVHASKKGVVGFGTQEPTSELEISASSTERIRIASSSAAGGRVPFAGFSFYCDDSDIDTLLVGTRSRENEAQVLISRSLKVASSAYSSGTMRTIGGLVIESDTTTYKMMHRKGGNFTIEVDDDRIMNITKDGKLNFNGLLTIKKTATVLGPAIAGAFDIEFLFVGSSSDDCTLTIETLADELTSTLKYVYSSGRAFSLIFGDSDFVIFPIHKSSSIVRMIHDENYEPETSSIEFDTATVSWNAENDDLEYGIRSTEGAARYIVRQYSDVATSQISFSSGDFTAKIVTMDLTTLSSTLQLLLSGSVVWEIKSNDVQVETDVFEHSNHMLFLSREKIHFVGENVSTASLSSEGELKTTITCSSESTSSFFLTNPREVYGWVAQNDDAIRLELNSSSIQLWRRTEASRDSFDAFVSPTNFTISHPITNSTLVLSSRYLKSRLYLVSDKLSGVVMKAGSTDPVFMTLESNVFQMGTNVPTWTYLYSPSNDTNKLLAKEVELQTLQVAIDPDTSSARVELKDRVFVKQSLRITDEDLSSSLYQVTSITRKGHQYSTAVKVTTTVLEIWQGMEVYKHSIFEESLSISGQLQVINTSLFSFGSGGANVYSPQISAVVMMSGLEISGDFTVGGDLGVQGTLSAVSGGIQMPTGIDSAVFFRSDNTSMRTTTNLYGNSDSELVCGSSFHASRTVTIKGNMYVSGNVKAAFSLNPGFGRGYIDRGVEYGMQTGKYLKMILGKDGRLLMIYMDDLAKSLRAACCLDALCKETEISELVPDNVDRGISLFVGIDGIPIFTYGIGSPYGMRVAKCADIHCSQLKGTHELMNGYTSPYTAGTVGRDGYPIFAMQTPNGQEVFHCGDEECAESNLITRVVVNTEKSEFSNIVVGADGYAAVTYYVPQVGLLVYHHCLDVLCQQFETKTLDGSTADTGSFASMNIGKDGKVIVAYKDSSAGNLKTFHCKSFSCDEDVDVHRFTIDDDPENEVGDDISLTIGQDGMPIVAYRSSLVGTTDTALKLARCVDVLCTAATAVVVDSEGEVGAYASLVLGTDMAPSISYFDNNKGKIKYTHCSNGFCLPYARF